ncbi:hypothetical protein BDZ45DRAFT_744701 [Acephala macrosclerotiorum]|nr:hypothetical protein BDZ45DRAFT_744701 [Acephala macrosclerotiorum]
MANNMSKQSESRESKGSLSNESPPSPSSSTSVHLKQQTTLLDVLRSDAAAGIHEKGQITIWDVLKREAGLGNGKVERTIQASDMSREELLERIKDLEEEMREVKENLAFCQRDRELIHAQLKTLYKELENITDIITKHAR